MKDETRDARVYCSFRLATGFEFVLRRANISSIGFKANLALNLQSLLAHAPQFETFLLNLAFNARDAMPDGGAISIRHQQP
ncbi:hypothetical protein RY831_32260 [Noviherbaspirillum sp. CPCC 100848]|uniref:Uncharacterized protein n=1 Tax=Noviherbaspirillum album TaxID=3080276 RepID=A0ABU6JJT5_9BURK|nr:hypothetical protein [Noviherbaspirillum sp. CPCC 100848]MEC4723795.1 hypothetical protein [Noviherbaspirillum sp. CPCC 100848]